MKQPSIKKNYIYRLLYELLSIVVSLVTVPYVSRVLGADGVGIYSYTASIMTYFTLCAALGTASYGAREIAQHRDDPKETSKLFWEIELMTVLTSMICLVVWIGVIIFSEEYRYYYIALIPVLLGTMVDISWYFTGQEHIKYTVLRNTMCKLLGIVLLLLLVKEKDDLLLYVAIESGVTLVGNLSMWTYLPGKLEKVDFKSLTFRRHFKETLIYFIPTIATAIGHTLDKTLIGLITQDECQNGYYEQATKIIKLMKILVFTSVSAVMEARIAYLFAGKKYEEIRRRIRKSMSFILLAGFGCAFGIIAVADRFVPLFFGKGFEPVTTLLCLMAPLIVILGISSCLGRQYFTPSGQRARSAKVIILGAVVNSCLNICMIPLWGANGAAVATLVSETLTSVLFVRMSDGYMTAANLWDCSKKKLLAGLLMWAGVSFLGKILPITGLTGLVIEVGAGVAIYGGVLLAAKDDMLLELLDMVWRKVTSIVCRIERKFGMKYAKPVTVEFEKPEFFRHPLVAHALGGLEGTYKYSNVLEGLQQSLELGYGFVEVDLTLTCDKKLVCSHGWSEQTYADTGVKMDAEHPVMTYEQFMKTRIQGKYTTIDASVIAETMKRCEHLLFEFDLQTLDKETAKETAEKIVEVFGTDRVITDRILLQVGSPQMYEGIHEVYPFRYYQYYVHKTEIPGIRKVLAFCREKGIVSVAIKEKFLTPRLLRKLKEQQLCVLIHPVDDKKRAKRWLELGVDTVCTNFLTAKDISE